MFFKIIIKVIVKKIIALHFTDMNDSVHKTIVYNCNYSNNKKHIKLSDPMLQI